MYFLTTTHKFVLIVGPGFSLFMDLMLVFIWAHRKPVLRADCYKTETKWRLCMSFFVHSHDMTWQAAYNDIKL